MQSRNFVLVLALCVGPVSRAHADVLCKSRTGSAFIRTSCHANETVVDPTSLSPALTPLSLVDNGATLRVRGVNLQVMSDSIAYTSVGGGSANYAQGDYSSVSGGTGNVTPGAFSTVTGGALTG